MLLVVSGLLDVVILYHDIAVAELAIFGDASTASFGEIALADGESPLGLVMSDSSNTNGELALCGAPVGVCATLGVANGLIMSITCVIEVVSDL